MSQTRNTLLVLVAMATLGGSFATQSKAEVIERVVATVNDEAIFLSDIRRRALPFLDRVMSAPTEEERVTGLGMLYQEITERAIDEELIEQAASRMQVRVTTTDVERAVDNVIRENGLTSEQFWQAVQGQGFTEAQYRSDVRRQLLRLKVINQRVRGRVNITESDVRERYDQRVRQANRQLRFRTSHVFLSLPASPSAADVASARAEAADVHSRLTLANFAQGIEEYGGGELGWLSQGDLPETLENALTELSDGEISEPVLGESGFHIFLLHERERGGSDLPEYSDVREQLYRQMMGAAMERQETSFLSELRREAIIHRML